MAAPESFRAREGAGFCDVKDLADAVLPGFAFLDIAARLANTGCLIFVLWLNQKPTS
jgi:hypothetical protein